MTQSHWFLLEDGRIIEHWANRDDLGMARQLGWIPPTPGLPVQDGPRQAPRPQGKLIPRRPVPLRRTRRLGFTGFDRAQPFGVRGPLPPIDEGRGPLTPFVRMPGRPAAPPVIPRG